MPFSVHDTRDQKEALKLLALVTRKAIGSPTVVTTARKIVNDCASRADECELKAIYNAVKRGTKAVKALERGVRYQSDPLPVDFFQGPLRTLKSCAQGACAEDCDGHAALVAALVGALGFRVGVRAWGPAKSPDYEHVYAVVGFPKEDPPDDPREWLGLDTTVPEASVGWDPPGGRWLTAVIV